MIGTDSLFGHFRKQRCQWCRIKGTAVQAPISGDKDLSSKSKGALNRVILIFPDGISQIIQLKIFFLPSGAFFFQYFLLGSDIQRSQLRRLHKGSFCLPKIFPETRDQLNQFEAVKYKSFWFSQADYDLFNGMPITAAYRPRQRLRASGGVLLCRFSVNCISFYLCIRQYSYHRW